MRLSFSESFFAKSHKKALEDLLQGYFNILGKPFWSTCKRC
jgi:hypothetical protein